MQGGGGWDGTGRDGGGYGHHDPAEKSVRQREKERLNDCGSAPVTPALENPASAPSKAVMITDRPEVVKSFVSAGSDLTRLPRVKHVSLYAFHLQRSRQQLQPAGLFRAVLSHRVGGTVKLSPAAAQLPLL